MCAKKPCKGVYLFTIRRVNVLEWQRSRGKVEGLSFSRARLLLHYSPCAFFLTYVSRVCAYDFCLELHVWTLTPEKKNVCKGSSWAVRRRQPRALTVERGEKQQRDLSADLLCDCAHVDTPLLKSAHKLWQRWRCSSPVVSQITRPVWKGKMADVGEESMTKQADIEHLLEHFSRTAYAAKGDVQVSTICSRLKFAYFRGFLGVIMYSYKRVC